MGWGGYGKGWSWGKGSGAPKKTSLAIPEDYEVDKEARYKGTVSTYYKWKGYGFVKLAQEGVLPHDTVFVHWSNIQTDDRFPFLVKDAEIEFGVFKWTEGWGTNRTPTLRAKHVTQTGGSKVSVQDEMDAEKKSFVGAQNFRYTGKLKFYNPQRGFGYVTVDEGFQYPEGETVPTELPVEESEINCGGKRCRTRLVDLKVEFGIVKNRKGKYFAYNMTLPGGSPLLKENVEHRVRVGDATYEGTINFFSGRQGWGFITPADGVTLPPEVVKKTEEMVAAAKAKGKNVREENALYFIKSDVDRSCRPAKDMVVTFKVYTDDKGAGACDVVAKEVAS